MSDPPENEFWDVVDLGTGERQTTLAMQHKQFLLGVTSLGAYVIAVDEDDVQRVLLYRHN